ncbi:MAG: STAS domain-containing protein [Planctomycetota bacterium]
MTALAATPLLDVRAVLGRITHAVVRADAYREHETHRLEARFEALAHDEEASRVVVEFQPEAETPSSVLKLLSNLGDHCAERGGRLVVVGLSAATREVCKRCGLDRRFDTADNVRIAMELATKPRDRGRNSFWWLRKAA